MKICESLLLWVILGLLGALLALPQSSSDLQFIIGCCIFRPAFDPKLYVLITKMAKKLFPKNAHGTTIIMEKESLN